MWLYVSTPVLLRILVIILLILVILLTKRPAGQTEDQHSALVQVYLMVSPNTAVDTSSWPSSWYFLTLYGSSLALVLKLGWTDVMPTSGHNNILVLSGSTQHTTSDANIFQWDNVSKNHEGKDTWCAVHSENLMSRSLQCEVAGRVHVPKIETNYLRR